MNTFAAKGGVMILIGFILTLLTGSASLEACNLNQGSDFVSKLTAAAGDVNSGTYTTSGQSFYTRPFSLPPDFTFFFEEPEAEDDDDFGRQSEKIGDDADVFSVKILPEYLFRLYKAIAPQHYFLPASTSRQVLFQVFRI